MNKFNSLILLNSLLIIIVFIFLLYCLINHPLVLGLILIILTILVSFHTIIISYNSWNGYILFLIFLGGLLILFLYNISLISTEIFNIKVSKGIFFYFVIFLCLNIECKERFNEDTLSLHYTKHVFVFNIFVKNFNISFVLFLVFYLFFCLICIINVIYINKGSL